MDNFNNNNNKNHPLKSSGYNDNKKSSPHQCWAASVSLCFSGVHPWMTVSKYTFCVETYIHLSAKLYLEQSPFHLGFMDSVHLGSMDSGVAHRSFHSTKSSHVYEIDHTNTQKYPGLDIKI